MQLAVSNERCKHEWRGTSKRIEIREVKIQDFLHVGFGQQHEMQLSVVDSRMCSSTSCGSVSRDGRSIPLPETTTSNDELLGLLVVIE